MTQTILGAGGAIGIPLARELKAFTSEIRLAGRNPKKVNDTDLLLPVDVNDLAQVEKAVAGSSVVYVTIGFEYNLKTWQRLWPPFIGAVIDACLKHQARLVFFDNVYMYDKAAIPFMSEGAAVVPPSGKGKVRAQVRAMILEAVEKRGLTALIARAADFYGPENRNSLLEIMVAQNLRKGKKAQAFGDPGRIHTFTYTPDAARATALLGNAPDTWNQEWHVTTTKEKLTMLDWIGLVAKELNTEPKIQKVPVWMVRMLGLFVPVMREFPEMLYQYDRDYLFDSSKIENRFGITATTPVEGIRKMLASNPG